MDVVEGVVATALCGAHALFLYRGYTAIAANGLSPSIKAAWLDPVVAAVGVVAYLCVVYFGTAFMRKQKNALSLRASMAVYNLYSTAFSALMLFLYLRELSKLPLLSWWTAPYSAATANASMAVFWLNYAAKSLEYADTVFMIGRKKFDQVSALHVIHHAEMGPLMLYYLNFFGGANTMFGPMLNCFIHTLMYGYYGAVGVGVQLSFLKAFMTSAQMVQFVIILIHSSFHLWHANKYWFVHCAAVQTLLMIQMLYMFGSFFQKSYLTKGDKGGRGAGDKLKAPGGKEA